MATQTEKPTQEKSKEVVGHVANGLQAALYREIVSLIEQGVLDVADSDAVVCWEPGLRWGVMGPNLLFQLGGGQGGIQHFMENLSRPPRHVMERPGDAHGIQSRSQANDHRRRVEGGWQPFD